MEKKKIYKNEMAVISADEINHAFVGEERQYLQGNLQREQKLPYIYDTKSEIGMTYYEKYSHDEPHYHDVIMESNYIISGRVKLLNVDTGEEYVVTEGGLFSIPVGTTHVLKAQPGTKILFVKNASMDDKHVVDFPGLEKWFADNKF